MRTRLTLALLAGFAGVLVASTIPAREARIQVGSARLYTREIGAGRSIVVLHGGPDFDHRYFLPDMDRLADSYRLIYYDQRGRGLSAEGVDPESVSLASEIADLDAVRRHFQLGSTVVLGHSWGSVLALEYAIRHPNRVSHLILMNPAPASAEDYQQLRKDRAEKLGPDLERLRAAGATAGYKAGDPDAVAAYYRIHFKQALARPEDVDKVVASLHASFTPEGVLKARRVEERLMNDTWLANGYNLLPKLASLRIPTLVIWGDHDFIPQDTSTHITRAIPGARMVTFQSCGHFSYLECPLDVRRALAEFFKKSANSSFLPQRDRWIR